jgi:co-chaperonin GroES (HSP10)
MMSENESSVYVPELTECCPARGWLLVKPDEKTNMTTGGIILPGGGEGVGTYRTGLVVAVGGPIKLDSGGYTDMPCDAGDSVLFTDGAAAPVSIGGEEHFLIRNVMVLARAKKAPRRIIKTANLKELLAPVEYNGGHPRPIR